MHLKQQTLPASLGCRATRRITHIGSHNSNWDVFVSEDVMELLVDSAIIDRDRYWTTLRKMRNISKAFCDVANAKLDAILMELKYRADKARREVELMTDHPRPIWIFQMKEWIKRVHETRIRDTVKYTAYDSYKEMLLLHFSKGTTQSLLMCNHCSGFWIHRDELFARRMDACINCRQAIHHLLQYDGTERTSMDQCSWTTQCHSSRACRPVVDLENTQKNKTRRQADAILSVRPIAKALDGLLKTHKFYHEYWVFPIKGIPIECTLLGASGMDMKDVDRIVAVEEAKDIAAAEERLVKRTARRDEALVKLENVAQAYLSANVPTIPTLARLQDLEELHGLEPSIPRRPFPSHRKLPLWRVRLDCMTILHENVARLTPSHRVQHTGR
jgi:hypothetical protein